MDSTSIIENILNGNHIEIWSVTISRIGYLLGLLFVVLGLVMFTRANSKGGMQRATHGAAVASLVAGIALLSLQAFVAAGTYTLFASEGAGDYSFNNGVMVIQDMGKGNGSGPEALYMELVIYVLQIVGLIAVIKATFLMREATTTSKAATGAVWHYVGGILSLNFSLAVKLVGETGGPDVQSVLSRIFG